MPKKFKSEEEVLEFLKEYERTKEERRLQDEKYISLHGLYNEIALKLKLK